ncbi:MULTISPECIES: hypothetical protein [Methylobacterium]|jgi:hypothetical protein|uniref:Pentapeptide MXKDX repeat protein n=2 Tax=Methylobacterium TaxID=407 RepID=A0A2R4WWQ0_9HYPH|nr:MULTISPECIES: hypothetical protein [Methylobacterium]AWB25212.1 hypothetical protein DA075_30190 [Methylobacterium currus]AWB25930.1 hypothetical protein DA075_34600 [Methylobacterium currus]TGD95189.1 hypothetical protein EU555_29185 [Methylobacterium nonmethylotrophicum]SFF81887.1 hypothetical protein SAMN04487844_15226 [Methylobacterium sp. yr596]
MSKISQLAPAALGFALFAGIAAASAETATNPAPSDKGVMGGMMQGDGIMPMMQEMSKMMGNCNKMMQTMMDRQNQGGSGQQNPDKRG